MASASTKVSTQGAEKENGDTIESFDGTAGAQHLKARNDSKT